MQKIICSLVSASLFLIATAQEASLSNLRVENFLDSAKIKKFKSKMDTTRIAIAPNQVEGIASYYANKFNGAKTANGEYFSNAKYTAACNLFKLNTIVRVTNLKNGKSVIVRINDRMHPNTLKKGRVIDLSQVAAKALFFNGKGLIKVQIEALSYSKTTPKIQVQEQP